MISKNTVHIAPGFSAGGSMIQALGYSRGVLANPDVLTCGPLSDFASAEAWQQAREAYWAQVYGDPTFSFAHARDLFSHVDELRASESINLWVGTGAAEQILIPWTVRFLQVVGIDVSLLRIIQFVSDPGRRFDAWGLGVLNPEQLKAHPEPRLIGEAAIRELEESWRLLTSPEPVGLLTLRTRTSRNFPYFHRSLDRLLDRYPDARTGVSRADFELLKYVREHGPQTTRVIGYAMAHNFDADIWGDGWLFWRLRRLADESLPNPAITFTGDPTSMRTCEVTLTPVGHEILAGTCNFLELNGIADWVLGVHLESKRNQVWCRTADGLATWVRA